MIADKASFLNDGIDLLTNHNKKGMTVAHRIHLLATQKNVAVYMLYC